jgi:hypothetical protein
MRRGDFVLRGRLSFYDHLVVNLIAKAGSYFSQIRLSTDYVFCAESRFLIEQYFVLNGKKDYGGSDRDFSRCER